MKPKESQKSGSAEQTHPSNEIQRKSEIRKRRANSLEQRNPKKVRNPESGLDAIRVDPGKAHVRDANVVLDDDYAREHLDVEPGAYVMIAVTDTGFGMDNKPRRAPSSRVSRPRIAERGTGLGLATAFGIIQQSCVWIGRFDTEEEVAVERDELARKLHGKKAKLNFPDDP